jgi:hypothetical protein
MAFGFVHRDLVLIVVVKEADSARVGYTVSIGRHIERDVLLRDLGVSS